METERRSNWRFVPAIIAITLLAIIAIPVALICCAIMEDAFFGTNYLEQLAQLTGTISAFEWLYEALKPVLGW